MDLHSFQVIFQAVYLPLLFTDEEPQRSREAWWPARAPQAQRVSPAICTQMWVLPCIYLCTDIPNHLRCLRCLCSAWRWEVIGEVSVTESFSWPSWRQAMVDKGHQAAHVTAGISDSPLSVLTHLCVAPGCLQRHHL